MRAFVVLTTTPDKKSAEKIAGVLVRQKLAACVSLRGGFESVYRWKGKVERAAETLLIIKTSKAKFPKLEKAIRANHPYDVPEILGFGASAGSKPYLNWMEHSLK